MGKIKKVLKHNKVMLVLGIILVLCFIALLYILVKYFYTGINGNAYGDRLENVENYKLDKDIENQVKKIYKDNDSVGEVGLIIQGKIIYISIDFIKAIKLDDAKSLALKSLDVFSEEEKKFYDIQFTLTANNIDENASFPTMGAKNASSSVVVWLNN